MSPRRLVVRALLAALVPIGFAIAGGCVQLFGLHQAQPGCGDGVKDGDETGIDCGGRCIGLCPGERCSTDDDCASGNCPVGICIEPSCEDLTWNGQETDLNCGGPLCAGCAQGEHCNVSCDCASGVCAGGKCQMGMPLGRCEAALSCAQCQDGHRCGSISSGEMECPNGKCTMNRCESDSAKLCGDSTKNGLETDTDCGGPKCDPCGADKACGMSSDCKSGSCMNMKCK